MRSRERAWLELVADLLDAPSPEFPRQVLAQQLYESFDIVNVSWNWLEPDGGHGFDMLDKSPERAVDVDFLRTWQELDVFQRHPLLRWYARSASPDPQTKHRVPREFASTADQAFVDEQLIPMQCEVQMSIPYVLEEGRHRAFVLARSETDFTDEDLALAGTLRRAFIGLERQTHAIQGWPCLTADGSHGVDRLATQAGLTGREAAVVALLLEGLTAQSIARRLGVSPRTVHKHLEHVYRKLGVKDRLGAARAVAELGVSLPPTDHPPG